MKHDTESHRNQQGAFVNGKEMQNESKSLGMSPSQGREIWLDQTGPSSNIKIYIMVRLQGMDSSIFSLLDSDDR